MTRVRRDPPGVPDQLDLPGHRDLPESKVYVASRVTRGHKASRDPSDLKDNRERLDRAVRSAHPDPLDPLDSPAWLDQRDGSETLADRVHEARRALSA